MSARGWAGFTEADIKEVQRGGGGGGPNLKPALQQRGGSRGGAQRGILGSKRGVVRAAGTTTHYTPLPPQARLSQDPDSPRSLSSQQTPESSPAPSPSPVPPSPCTSPTGNQTHPKSVKIRLGENNSYEVIPSSGTPDSPPSPRTDGDGGGAEEEEEEGSGEFFINKGGGGGGKEEEGALLENLQKRQREMEEQNKRRKELLMQAIEDRSRRTKSEAQKLKHIQKELSRLDSLLSTDVAILRNQIEAASQEFNEAQKRYERAEREFIEAKLQLFGRLERKELLTEHLCRIIEANERRKAEKLSELMAQLEVVDCVGELPSPPTPSECLPQLASLDEVSYAACTTLKHPLKAAQALHAGLARVNGNLRVEEVRRAAARKEEEMQEETKEVKENEKDTKEDETREVKEKEDETKEIKEEERKERKESLGEVGKRKEEEEKRGEGEGEGEGGGGGGGGDE
ncbi:RAB6-interacting golgin-like isoform X1 [Eriocheir sinensis]|uniref:RAB6-interacting golgin-like isoform X1 n=1 Tax=Eriocheir sinensis TaxID=95602 RepID=UPI0021C596A5|nr:RAB6-interacting golgin-like isoform X1 [Eriocheir sinensis]